MGGGDVEEDAGPQWPPRHDSFVAGLLPAKPETDGLAKKDKAEMYKVLGVHPDADGTDVAQHKVGAWASAQRARERAAFGAMVRQERINLVREQLAECNRKTGVDQHAKCATLMELYHVQRHLDRVGNYREHLPAGLKSGDVGW